LATDSPARLILEIDIRELLPGAVLYGEGIRPLQPLVFR
jgi:hypothetical protein